MESAGAGAGAAARGAPDVFGLRRLRRLALAALGWTMALCVVGSVGWAAVYRFIAPPVTLTMVERALDGHRIDHRFVPLDEISPNLVRAVIAAEDARFCSHRGVDLAATRLAIAEARAGRGLRGASTITQQTAKNAFLWGGGGFARKGAEAWFAAWIELAWGKRRIMEVYLNVAEWGDGIFGAEAAARARFGVSAADLSPRQAALLAAVLPSPNRWRVDPPGDYVRARASRLEREIRDVELTGADACVLGGRP